jgi:GntR family transcriptional regulator, rspAB operon transcriptional repressor
MVDAQSLSIELLDQDRRQPIHQWAYQVLRASIIELHIKPAQRISEKEISQALGISRTPVREAFIRLAGDGLILITPQKRSIVTPIDLEQAQEARFVRLALEKAVLREACGSFSTADIDDLKENIQAQLRCRREKAYDRMLIVDNEFHRIIFRGCRKEQSWFYVKKMDHNYDRLRTMVMPVSLDHIIAEHTAILQIIERRDIRHIDAAVDRHLTWETINAAVKDYPPQYFKQHFPPSPGSAGGPKAGVAKKPKRKEDKGAKKVIPVRRS